MPEYTLLATCDRCKKQVVSNPKNEQDRVIAATGLRYHDYVYRSDSVSGAYLCPDCHQLASEMRVRHYEERKVFCTA
jgi:hypothetical protein